ncbi:2-oxoglutarate dehydrogenase E1 component [Capnocytophaga canimorsus]|uniref:2-oxoglutarate dehydrogenase E1 component n=1 Tax=Capnocytophaga canimorsus TaxID=28188 RepID=UPI0037CCCBDD
MDKYSFLNAASTAYFGELYERYLENPDAIEPSWRAFFQGFDFAQENYGYEQAVETVVQQISNDTEGSFVCEKLQKEFKVINLINGYRTHGHLFTKTNPIRERELHKPDLSIENYGLTPTDLDIVFDSAKEIGLQPTSLRNIIEQLNKIFCASVGIEYTYIREPKTITWIQERLQKNANQPNFNKNEKIQILNKLNEAVSFENFLHTKYVGQKRFSLEGGEAIIPALDFVINTAAEQGVEHFVMGMAHRGRLNVLANILKKSPQDIFSEFDGKDYEVENFDGDVKYHLGLTSERVTPSGKKINLNLAPNPSHLETVSAVIEGITRAKQDRYFPNDISKVLPVAIHGDAAIAGQGLVYEVIQMAKLKGFKTGGTIHIVINNQVGFTTNNTDARSGTYCTDIAKVTNSPVLHVNSDDTEAVVHALLFALDYRMTFGTDIFIDLLGYRKYGHNEGDEPRFTQPKLYKIIAKHDNPRTIYAKKLSEQGIIEEGYVGNIEAEYKAKLEVDLEASRQETLTVIKPFMQDEWQGFEIASQEKMLEKVNTKFNADDLSEIAQIITELPSDKGFINKIKKIISDRKDGFFNNHTVDWGMAEHLAFATLLTEGFDVRLTGQDVQRGTFSHRHAVVKSEDLEEEVVMLHQLKNKEKFSKGNFYVYNSLLSEYGVLGFEYGYALASPNTLTIWEAQFGDFSNGAQIMIDQYVCCGEDKWKNQNGVVLLLPHGYEGQGSEHSSARIERYLQLCANKNMYVANCTTPANIFHLLRRQMKTDFRKPLVVFSPKSLLRHPEVVSPINDLANGQFQEVIDDPNVDPKKVKTLVFCSGKFYYDLKAEREKLGRDDVALIRIEQLFPLPTQQIKAVIAKYKKANDYVWAQEEPKNMGAYGYMLMYFDWIKWRLACVRATSAPAPGSYTRDRKYHQQAINAVFDSNIDHRKN